MNRHGFADNYEIAANTVSARGKTEYHSKTYTWDEESGPKRLVVRHNDETDKSGPVHTIVDRENGFVAVSDGQMRGVPGELASRAVLLAMREGMYEQGAVPKSPADIMDKLRTSDLIDTVQKRVLDVHGLATVSGLFLPQRRHGDVVGFSIGDGGIVVRRPDRMLNPDGQSFDDDRCGFVTTAQAGDEGLECYFGEFGDMMPKEVSATPIDRLGCGVMDALQIGRIATLPDTRIIIANNGAFGGYPHERRSQKEWLDDTNRDLSATTAALRVALMGQKLGNTGAIVVDCP